MAALLGVILGVVLASLFEWLFSKRRRFDKQIEIMSALHAEISSARQSVEEQTDPAESKYLEKNQYPFGPSDRCDFVFDSVKSDLSALPQEVIYSIVRYYRLTEQSNRLVDHLTESSYEKTIKRGAPEICCEHTQQVA